LPTIEANRSYLRRPVVPHVAKAKKDTLGMATLFERGGAERFGYIFRLVLFIAAQDRSGSHQLSLKPTSSEESPGAYAAPVVWHVRDRIEDDYLLDPLRRAFDSCVA